MVLHQEINLKNDFLVFYDKIFDFLTFRQFHSIHFRSELKLEKPGIPITIRAPSLPDSRSNEYLNFGPTDLEKDAGQTTIPYLDIQPVVTIPPFPLSGAGIYHKGRKGSGGFVAPRIITYDFVKHLKAELPPQTPVLGVNDIPVV